MEGFSVFSLYCGDMLRKRVAHVQQASSAMMDRENAEEGYDKKEHRNLTSFLSGGEEQSRNQLLC